MRKKHFIGMGLAVLLLVCAAPVCAQDPSARPDEFAAPATAIDGINLLTSRYVISLWGVEPISAPGANLSLKARTALDNLIDGRTVRCEVKEWRAERPMARCLNAGEQDLGLAMIAAGYAVADRPAVGGTVFEAQYKEAEKRAQDSRQGGWATGGSDTAYLKYFYNNEQFLYGWIIATLLLPLAGFALTWLLVMARFSALERYLAETVGESEERKKELREQERFVVASMIEGELSANKGKLEAFIIIYKDLLKSLRQSKEHRYQTNGEIVHEAPLLERIVYENNVDRLKLLGASMAGDIAGLYGYIQSNPKYTTLDSSIPLDEAILKVQKVVSDAEALIPRIDKIIQSLHVTIRDKQSRQMKANL